MVDKVMKHYILPLDQPVVSLDCSEAFEGLSQKEKLYSHYLSQGAWIGGLVVLVQVRLICLLTKCRRLGNLFQSPKF